MRTTEQLASALEEWQDYVTDEDLRELLREAAEQMHRLAGLEK